MCVSSCMNLHVCTCVSACQCVRACVCACMHVCACVCVRVCVSQSYVARGEGTGDPEQVQGLKGDQDEADVGRQVLGTLGVHEVVGGPAAGVLLITHGGSQVYSERRNRRKEDLVESMLENRSKINRMACARVATVVYRVAEKNMMLYIFPSGRLILRVSRRLNIELVCCRRHGPACGVGNE